jgi:hypothetical protein
VVVHSQHIDVQSAAGCELQLLLDVSGHHTSKNQAASIVFCRGALRRHRSGESVIEHALALALSPYFAEHVFGFSSACR